MTKIEEALKQPGRVIRIKRSQKLQLDESKKAGLSVELVILSDVNHQLVEVGVCVAATDPNSSRKREVYFDSDELEGVQRCIQRVDEVVTAKTSRTTQDIPIRYTHSDELVFEAPGTKAADPVTLTLGDDRPRLDRHPVTLTFAGVELKDFAMAIKESRRAIEQVLANSR